MPKHFCVCISLKSGAIIMSFLNLLEGAVLAVSAIIELSDLEAKERLNSMTRKVNILENICNKTEICNSTTIHHYKYGDEVSGLEGHVTLFSVCLAVGLLSMFNGILLLVGIIKAKEKYVLLYLLLGSTTLFIVIIYSGIYMFKNGVLFLLFCFSVFMCYGQVFMFYFYEEVAEYNTVKSGVIEISYNGDPKSYDNSAVAADGIIDNTAV
ncbi:hypothetical protein TcasGA2_TC032908 [Tribolium castaneum]|uniref:Uncharacterized protein n=1 Tax=Tribolium castaneum TaxID=7070 RepID=A0A139WJX2_TRICA|nr:PREDICTED: uncharacterized protein LOC103312867 [Tribolium castaneum]XP_015835080.1 PREDICTED: uncharacterized protein LOC103312867 [Tribolium castaneum]XP_015835081.1 PREDICTED: uncharacterized protein LOC103312867 [Tribolium castaneum]XP_015835082.1 PREDICTED: uncharacterized protein LOC103312867 [Tribolium castaneum]KYB28194.1 hypothetical protein TcasGA2_TC032908 [Tribolium castaneum]|eukprot:XP_008192871.1 PREDICTED: uncharacterized protein LOC103312867 [Tribolium castaneum]